MEDINECAFCGTKVLKEDMNKHIKICSKKKERYDKRPKEESKKNILPKKKRRRKSIEGSLRILVWNRYIGNHTEYKCFCCWKNRITPFTYYNTFQAGHIKSHANGGPDSIENLIPICRDCNMNMSDENWDDYVARQPHLPLRTYGAHPPKKVIWATTIIQSLARMWLERKKPDSAWRLEWRRQYQIS